MVSIREKVDMRKSKVAPYGGMKQSSLVVKNEETFLGMSKVDMNNP